MFYQNLPSESSLYRLFSKLERLDRELAEEGRVRGCGVCGGRLDSARYPRKVRGVPRELEEAFSSRHSFCCAREGCRKRSTPASFRFLGRRVFAGAVVVLMTALEHGVTPARARRLREVVGVSRRTLVRWRRWWQRELVASGFWRAWRGRLRRAVEEEKLPLSLLTAFGSESQRDPLVALLGFLLPVTTSGGMQAR